MHWHLSLVSLALVSFPTAGASQAKPDRPNVIFLMIDQVRTDALGAYGGGKNASTPHIDRLAREGVVFTNAISSTPLCTPYRGMLMTGHTYVKWLAGKEELYDNVDDRYQMKNLVADSKHLATLKHLRQRMATLLAEAHDEFLPGTKYADWYDDERVLVRTALGPIKRP